MKKIIALILSLCMVFCLCACGSDAGEDTNKTSKPQESQDDVSTELKEDETPKFVVTVVDQNGDPVPNVMVQLCKDVCFPSKADENGIATFNAEITDGHKISLSICPEGYETEYVGTNYLYLEEGITEYTFEITKK